MNDVTIIGGGVIGCCLQFALSRYELSSLLIEKNADVAEGISKANSGVIHAGFNVPKGTLKAQMNVAGLKTIYGLAESLGVPHKKTGKLVVAFDDEGRDRLQLLKEQGDANGSPDLEIIDRKRIKELEPLAEGQWALWSPHTGIISPYHFTIALAENAAANGSEILLEEPIRSIRRDGGDFIVVTDHEEIKTRWVINAAGMESDSIARMVGIEDYTIFPYRGEYLITDKADDLGLKMPVYPVPPKDGPGLGVHVTPTMENTILIGPSAEYTGNKEDVATTRSITDQLKAEAFELMPELKKIPIIHAYSGIRPKLVDPNSKEKFKDFVIEESLEVPRFINLIGIESPGLTSAPAIAERVLQIISRSENPAKKKDFRIIRNDHRRFADMPPEERQRMVEEDSRWGEMVCRCESVTRMEVERALDSLPGRPTLDAVKRRTRCGMGRCQGAFCTPRIVQILEERNIDSGRLTKRGEGTELFYGRIKD